MARIYGTRFRATSLSISGQPGVKFPFRLAGLADNGTVVGKNNGRKLATFSLTNGLRETGEGYPGDSKLLPTAVNDRAWTVGHRLGKAFLYVYGQGIRDLDTLLVTPLPQSLTHAIDINDRDEILARTSSPARYYILRRVRE